MHVSISIHGYGYLLKIRGILMIHALMLQNFVVNICALFLQDWKAGFPNFDVKSSTCVCEHLCVYVWAYS